MKTKVFKPNTHICRGINMKKSLLVLSLATLAFLLFFSCSKKEEKKEEKTNSTVTTVANESKDDGMEVFEDIGFKVRLPKEFNDLDGNITAQELGDDTDEEEPVLGGLQYQYISDTTKQDTDKILNDDSLSRQEKKDKIDNEIYPRIKDIFSLATLRANLVKDENEIKEILFASDIKVVRKTDKYIQVITFSDGSNVEGLTEEEQKQYKEFINVAKSIQDMAQAMDPKPKTQALQSITGLNFKTQDLEGNEVTSDIFKNADVTMVNIWATWCGPCKEELPDIGRVAKKYRAKGAQVVAICSDVMEGDDSVLDEAKEIIQDSECDFIVLRNNSSFDSIFKNIQAFPTTLFFDKNGDLVGDVVIGGRSEAEFEALFEEILAKVKK